jgi:pimeloyl-ACP methyl ester carboxylesterase
MALSHYQVKRPAKSQYVSLRHWRYHYRIWHAPKVTDQHRFMFLLHGWMDISASFQFLVDVLERNPNCTMVAPDWRGFGQTVRFDGAPIDYYDVTEYLGDLDFLLDHIAPNQKVDLVAHSMGGNVAMLYAGIRPQRIRRLVNLEGVGLPETKPEYAPVRYTEWLEDLHDLALGKKGLRSYQSLDDVAQRLIQTNPLLTQNKALWLATYWATQGDDGLWHIEADAAHKVVSARRYHVDEVLAIYRLIEAPVLSIIGKETKVFGRWGHTYKLEEYQQRMDVIRNIRYAIIDQAGHMLHHDQPEIIAKWIDGFLKY